jgi:cell division protein FtsI (penicillin-binding protein 3)
MNSASTAHRPHLAARASIATVVSAGRPGLVHVRSQALTDARKRGLWVLLAFLLIFIIALVRITYLGMADPARPDGDAAAAPTERGDILDRNGVPLARAFPAYSLWFNPHAMGDGPALVHSPAEVAMALHRIFPDEDVAELTQRLASGKAGYLRRRILPEEANKIHALGEPALEFPREA